MICNNYLFYFLFLLVKTLLFKQIVITLHPEFTNKVKRRIMDIHLLSILSFMLLVYSGKQHH